MKSYISLFLMLWWLLQSCGPRNTTESDAVEVVTDTVVTTSYENDFTSVAWNMADSLFNTMSFEQRVGQCFMPTIFAKSDSVTLGRLRTYMDELHVGGIVLLKGDLRSASEIASIASRGGVPMFTAIDAEWGLGMRLSDAPAFPRNGWLSAEADEQLLFDYGYEVARECRRVGINMVLGPVVDVISESHGAIGSRSFGSDPIRVADLGVAYARGVESGGVLSVAKHFPGHGSPAEDSHKALPVIGRSLHMLDSIDLYPFRSYIDAGLSCVMVGHLAVPAIDPECLPGAVSEVVIKDLLREELGFRGLVLTDALNMQGAEGYGAAAAIKAGADIVVGPADTAGEVEDVITAVDNGDIDQREIDDRCLRILFYKCLLRLGPVTLPDIDKLRKDVAGEAAPIRRQLQNVGKR